MALYTIIMPVYNASETLDRSINSIVQQTFQDWELISVDDGSTDDSIEVLKKFSEKDSRIKVIHQENAGPGAARNNGISKSNGKYIAFLDSDDYWEPDFLSLAESTNSGGNTDIIFLDRVYERPDRSVIMYSHIYSYKNLTKYELICNQMTGKIPWGMVKIIKREILQNINCAFSSLNVGEEAIFSFEVLKNAETIAFVEKPIYHYVQNANGQHKKGDYDPWNPVVSYMKKHLMEIGEYQKYKSTVNSLALRSLCICIYRYACNYPLHESISLIKKKYNEYGKTYDLSQINTNALDKSSKIIFMFLKTKMYVALFWVSRIRKKFLAN